MGIYDDVPDYTVYRTNGLIWAAFSKYRDGTEEPSDIFRNAQEMVRDADRRDRVRIDFRPQELGMRNERPRTSGNPSTRGDFRRQ